MILDGSQKETLQQTELPLQTLHRRFQVFRAKRKARKNIARKIGSQYVTSINVNYHNLHLNMLRQCYIFVPHMESSPLAHVHVPSINEAPKIGHCIECYIKN